MKYWYHPESDSHYTTDDDQQPSGDGMSIEVSRDDYLCGLAVDAIRNAASNDGSVPDDPVEAAAEMVEQGVFGPSEECVDHYGKPMLEYIEAVVKAKKSVIR